MNKISHKQAMKLIHLRLDGLLKASEILSLEEHLHSCDSCRIYSTEMDLLPARLQNEFHIRWDNRPGPSQKVFDHVTAGASNIAMANRISSGVKLFAGAMALIVLGIAINFVISQLQSTSPVTNATETVDTSPLPQERLLAFASDQNGNFDIYTMHADGSGLTNLTDSPAYDSNPFWSPDGKHIAFVSSHAGSFGQIYLMDADGSDIVQLTHDQANHEFSRNYRASSGPWSPDGSMLIFSVWLPGEEKWTLYTMDINGENKTPLVNETDIYSSISWSPDGKHIAFVAYDLQNLGGDRLYVVNADGSNRREITKSLQQNEQLSNSDYYWSPDGQSIFFIAFLQKPDPYWTVYEANLDGNTLVEKATTSSSIHDWQDETLLVTSFASGSPFKWLLSDGTNNILYPYEKCQQVDAYQSGSYIKRSPNGNWVINAYCPNGDSWFYWANSNGTAIKELLNSPISAKGMNLIDIVWSPDDKFIALNIASSDKSDIYVLNVSESLEDPSTQPLNIANSSSPSWQPIHVSEVVDNSPDMKIDPESCKAVSELDSALQAPDELYGYELVQGASLVDGDFSFEFWLYCDPSLRPDDNEHFSGVAGLGVYASWRYNGPEVEGTSQDYFGFEPIDKGKSFTKWIGPLYMASAFERFGVILAEETIWEHMQQGTPIQFSILVDSSLGQNGATFSFQLEPTKNGLRIVDLQANQAENSYDGLIAFTSANENGNLDIYTLHADGSGLTNLTSNPARDDSPVWSPDGHKIAFVSERTGNADIFVMNSDGSHLTQLTDNPGYDGFFSLSPNGERIIYSSSSSNDSNLASLVIMNADGSNKTKLTDPGSYIFLGWSPDGEKITYLEQVSELPQDDKIHVSDIDGRNHYEWAAIIDEIQWEDEQYFVGYGWSGVSEPPTWDLYRFSSDGTPPVKITTHSSRIIALYDHMHIVEGSMLLAWYASDGNPAPVKSWDVKGECKQRGDPFLQETGPAISPDGKRVFITVYCNDGYVQFYFADADGSELKLLTDFSVETSIVSSGTWSPDGNYVMIPITRKDGTKTDFYLLDIEKMIRDPSTQPIQITTDGNEKHDIAWQPHP